MAGTSTKIKKYVKDALSSGRGVSGIPDIAKAYENDPRTKLGVQSMADGSSTDPVAQGKYAYGDAVARALQGALGGVIDRRQQEKYGARTDAAVNAQHAAAQDPMAGMVSAPMPGAAMSPGGGPSGGTPAAPQIAAALQGVPSVQRAPGGFPAGQGAMPSPALPAPVQAGGGAPAVAPVAAVAAPALAGNQGSLGGVVSQIATQLQQPSTGAPQATGGQPGGGQSPFVQPPPRPGVPTLFDLSSGAKALKAQGATITSGFRTPAKNASLPGSVSNSFHMQGTPDNPQAYDFTPKAGQTMAQLEALARQNFPGYDVINEKNHIHVEPSKAMMAQAGSGNIPPPPAPPIDGLGQPQHVTIPDAPPAMERPSAPQPVAATRSPLLQAAYKMMLGSTEDTYTTAQGMYEKGLSEQGTLNENAAEREQTLRNAGYQNDLGMYSSDVNSRRTAALNAQAAAVKTNTDRDDSYVDWQRKAAEAEAERRNRVQVANIAAQRAIDVAGINNGPKVLSPQASEKLVKAGTQLDLVTSLASTFKPDFVRKPVFGGTQIGLNKVVGGNPELAQWWQDYDTFISETRHTLFGSAFTPNEQRQFEKMIITPGTAGNVAANNIARQKEMVETALGRTSRAIAVGYDPAAVQEAIGRDPTTLGVKAAPSGNAAPLSPSEQAELDQLRAKYGKR